MAMSALRNEIGSHNSSGNYGIQDQIFALHWIQQNIEGFGGDKNKVTIYGESAGAYSVCVLLASPLSQSTVLDVTSYTNELFFILVKYARAMRVVYVNSQAVIYGSKLL